MYQPKRKDFFPHSVFLQFLEANMVGKQLDGSQGNCLET